MSSLWCFVPGVGWVLQPVPVSPGCVIAPEVPQGFGFRRFLHEMRRTLSVVGVLHVVAGVLTTGGLVWMWLAGHEVETVGAVLAGIAVGMTAAVYGDIKRVLQRRRARRVFGAGGERAWAA
ncbi:hypothetical protein ACWGBJ_42945 [Streptomyces sp. NPDC054951]